MSALQPGGAAVGLLADLPEFERRIVERFRAWSGRGASPSSMDRMLGVIAAHARRPLVRHAPGCPCCGGDEAAIAHFVGHVARGELADAGMLASCFVRPSALPDLIAATLDLAGTGTGPDAARLH